MKNLNDWVFTLVGVLWLLPQFMNTDPWGTWLIGLGFLVVGVKGLMGK